MEKGRIFLYRELYYWMFFYTKKLKPYMGVKYTAFTCLQILKLFNVLNFWFIIGLFVKKDDYMIGIVQYLFIVLLVTIILDLLFLYPKSDYIITIYEQQFSKKRRIIGQLKFWVYVGLTLILLGIGIIYGCK